MIDWKKPSVMIGAVVLVLAAVVAAGWRRTAPPLEPPSPFTITDHRVTLSADSRMGGLLQIAEVGEGAVESTAFRAVGQIIALSNTSGDLMGNPVGWVELDPQVSRSVGMDFAASAPKAVGVAYGLTVIPLEYASRLHAGQPVEIMRYGLRTSGASGEIAKVDTRADSADVVFRFSKAQDWFPGTNCEVVFPILRGHPVRIPTTAPIHEGSQEYVWKEVGPNQFEADGISIVDSTPDSVSVLGLHPGDKIVARGAILLKPLLHSLITGRKG